MSNEIDEWNSAQIEEIKMEKDFEMNEESISSRKKKSSQSLNQNLNQS